MNIVHKRFLQPLLVVGLVALSAGAVITTVQAAKVIVTTLTPASVTTTTADLRCTVNPGNLSTKVWFVYGLSGKYNLVTPQITVTGSTPVEVKQTVSALKAATKYNYKCKAINSDSSRDVVGTAVSFTTLAVTPPTILNEPATDITESSASANCSVNPNGTSADVWATYKTASDTWGSTTNKSTPAANLSGTNNVPVSFPLSGLLASTVYEYRCSAKNLSTTLQTDVLTRSFSTAAPVITPPVVQNVAASAVAGTSATLNCDVSPGGTIADVWVSYQAQTDAPAEVNTLSSTSQQKAGTELQRSSFQIAGLAVNTTYSFRCNASNGVGAVVVDENALTLKTLEQDPVIAPEVGVTIMSAGDICDPLPITCTPVANLIRSHNPDKVIMLGDMQYPDGTFQQISGSYGTLEAWGSFKDKTIPVPGNHEKRDPSGAFAGYCQYWSVAAHCGTTENLSYREDLGRWSVVVLENSGTTSTVKKQRLTDLITQANAEGDNVAVAMHEPRWSTLCTNSAQHSGCHGSSLGMKDYYDIAVANGVDLMLVSHDHKYERTDRMDGSGPNPNGIPQFLSGLGGAHPDPGCDATRQAWSLFCAGTSQAVADGGEKTDVVSNDGVLKMKLLDTKFTWEFVSSDGTELGKVIDSGSLNTR